MIAFIWVFNWLLFFMYTMVLYWRRTTGKISSIYTSQWLTQDLAAERNELETKIQSHTKDPNFTSVTPQRQMEYGVDFSKYIDDDADDLSDDAAENGLLSLEMSDDADINPQVCAICDSRANSQLFAFFCVG